LCHEFLERLGFVDLAEIVQDTREESRVQEMHYSVFDTSDVVVDGRPVVRYVLVERRVVVVGRRVTQEVPRRVEEGVHRVGFASRVLSAFGTGRLDEARGFFERVPARLYELGEFDGEFVVGDEDGSAVVTVHHRNRRAPVTLARNEPVAEAVVDRFARTVDLLDDSRARLLARHTVVLSGS